MRCFAAVDVPEDVKSAIEKLQRKLSRNGISLTEKENLHYTLKFLGEIDENAVEKVETVLCAIAAKFSPFKVAVKGVGAFPDLTYARVIWIGGQELYELQKAVDEGLSGIFQKDIKPHMTIARVKFIDDKDDIAQFVRKNRGIEVGTFDVNEFKLKMSTLTREGPVYEDVRAFKLGSP